MFGHIKRLKELGIQIYKEIERIRDIDIIKGFKDQEILYLNIIKLGVEFDERIQMRTTIEFLIGLKISR